MDRFQPDKYDISSRRHLLITGALGLSVMLGIAVAIQSVRTGRERMAATRRALQDHADFAALLLASSVYRRLGDEGTQLIANWSPGHPPVVPASLACPGGNAYFASGPDADLRTGGPLLSPAQRAFLQDSLLRHQGGERLLAEARWRLRFVRDPTDASGYFIYRRRGLVGVRVCFDQADRSSGPVSLFRRAMVAEPVLPAGSVGDLPVDSILALTVTSAGPGPLYRSPGGVSSPFVGVAPIGADLFGDLGVRVDLQPGLAYRLVRDRLPTERTLLVLGLLALSGLLVVTALLQLRREYRLIAERSAFVANVSHELRTPLFQILLFTDLLRLDRLRSESDRRRAFDVVEQETRRLIRLVENVLQFSRLGAGRPAPEIEAIPLAEEIEGAVAAFHPLASARGTTVETTVLPELAIHGTRPGLRQVLINLLDNAAKYGPDGQRIRIEAMGTEAKVRITIDDEGPGIPIQERERVWEGHYRGKREERSTITGSGLGLAVVRGLVAEMGGNTWVEEAPSGGTRIILELPAAGARP